MHKWLQTPEEVQAPKYVRAKGYSKLGAFTDELELALKADALRPKKDRRTARALFAQIKASGYAGGYPAEIEGYINELPGVAESAVIGIPHAAFGEVGVALVIAKPGATLDTARILASLKATLANFKVPKHCVVVDALPRNAMGKVQKNVLRTQYGGV